MWILIVLFVLLFLLMLLSMPLIVEARMRLSLRGAVVHAKIWLLGLIPIPFRLRLYLLHAPYFTLQIGKKRIRLLQKRSDRGKPRIEGVRFLRLETRTTVGIEDEPAEAVQLAGTIAVLFSMLTTRVAESGSAKAVLSGHGMLRIAAQTRAIANPVQLLVGFARGRIVRQKTAKNIRKTNEKRKTYASC